MNQLELFDNTPNQGPAGTADILSYDKYIVAFSGGKDSTACFLYLLEQGVPLSKIELHHHDIDGREGSNLMDWPVTRAYCQAFADHFGVPIYYSWKVGGFEGEMNRDQVPTAATKFETPGGEIRTVGGQSKKTGTRRKFPQIQGSLQTRWCSAYLKIDVCDKVINNQDRFKGIRTVILSGERAEEAFRSKEKFQLYLDNKLTKEELKGRASYEALEPDRTDRRDSKMKRHVDRARPIKDWPESEVWAIMERFKVRAHPAYILGFSRCSCQFCIFGNPDQFASAKQISPNRFNTLVDYEKDYGVTMQRKDNLETYAAKGTAYSAVTPERSETATSTNYTESIIMDQWELPSGAYGDGCGPTN